jgi:hypothetical protein
VSDTELLPKSKPEPVRRLEVFTGTGRRRAWSAEQKARMIAESYQSDETVSAIARRYGLTPQQLQGKAACGFLNVPQLALSRCKVMADEVIE